MILSSAHVETRIPVLRQLIRDNALGVLTTAIPSDKHSHIQLSHIPFILDVQDEGSDTELRVLRGHVARQNPQSQAMIEALESSGSNVLEQEVLVLFTAAPHHYVTPKFCTETKPTTAKVVPTWNYAAVQAYGRAMVYYDSKSETSFNFLQKQLGDLSDHTEKSIMNYTGKEDQPGPWQVLDALEPYIELMKKDIIGIEIAIHRLEGKFKMSQEMRKGDREGVIKGFGSMESEAAQAIATMVQKCSDLKEAQKN
ncbi:transcriptional regulator [Fusarium denticulatum]|uniref:Transcriptional regulator n=1 Tax=Fusarium denticulatum TaxID=48507 RepID=A0A8H5X622_9HYPO|nr:transcriptional regulator [Fusarium denticulatum]